METLRGLSKNHCLALVNLAKYLEIFEVSVNEELLEENKNSKTTKTVFDKYIEIVAKMVSQDKVFCLPFKDGRVYFLTDRDDSIRCFVETGDFGDGEDDYDIFDMGSEISPKFLIQHIYLGFPFKKNILKNSLEKKQELLQEN